MRCWIENFWRQYYINNKTIFHLVKINCIKHPTPLAFTNTELFIAPVHLSRWQCSHSPSLSLLPVWPLPTPSGRRSHYETPCCLGTTTRLSRERTGLTASERALLRPDAFRTTTSKQRMRRTIYARWMTGRWTTRATPRATSSAHRVGCTARWRET